MFLIGVGYRTLIELISDEKSVNFFFFLLVKKKVSNFKPKVDNLNFD